MPKIKVVHKPGGYMGYMDQIPIRSPQWRAIFVMVASIFACGGLCSLSGYGYLFTLGSNPAPATIAPESTESIRSELTAIVREPLPTITLTLSPTIDATATTDLQATVDYVSNQLFAMQTQTALPHDTPIASTTPAPTLTPAATNTPDSTPTLFYSRVGVVIFDNVIIRASSGQRFEALDMAYRGQEFPVLDVYNGWVQILHPGHETAWIASHLLMIEDR